MSQASTTKPRRSPFVIFLDAVEWLGNLLPHPVTLFAVLCVGVLLLSGVAGYFEWSVQDPRPGRGTIEAVSLLNPAGMRRVAQGLVTNFTGFAPLGTVLVALLGVGVAERSGLLGAAIRTLVLGAPRNMLTIAVVFAAVVSNTASEMGYVVLIPLAAVVFQSVGRHPLAGMAAAFAGVSGGYSANILIGTVDPLLAGITTESAAILVPDYAPGGPLEIAATANWYFMIISTFMITAIGTWITVKVVEPKLGAWDASNADEDVLTSTRDMGSLTAQERHGLVCAAFSILCMVAVLVWFSLPNRHALWRLDFAFLGAFRDPEGFGPTLGQLRPLLKSVVALIFVFFIVPALVYGRVVGTMRSDRDVIDGMSKAMSSMGLYLVLVFFAAQFVAYFKWTELGSITAVVGADILRDIGLTGPLVFIPFILMCCFVNLMLGSASAQWSITAPIFVPMLMLLGYSPEVIQAAYRIGDSTTNTITPMMSYFGLILAFAMRYDRKLGIGTLISMMIPYSLCFLIGWVILFYVWVFVLGLPVGPGAPTRIPPIPGITE